MLKLLWRLGLVEFIGPDDDKFMTRINLLTTPWGSLKFHIFHRGDPDPDPHDHPWDFWTFPLDTYWELVLGSDDRVRQNDVVCHQWHHRPATYRHSVRGVVTGTRRQDGGVGGPVRTIVWTGPKTRAWGFWVVPKGLMKRHWVEWRIYRGAQH